MALIEELLPASFNGKVFLISSSSVAGGRKDKVHSFPNSDKQTIEDLGLAPRRHSVVGWIAEPDYKDKRDSLLASLEGGEVGVLSHPFYGDIENVKCRSFTIAEKITELGRAEISMIFEISDDIGVPKETGVALSSINADNEALQSSVGDAIANEWEVNPSFIGNFENAREKLASFSDSYSEFLGPVNIITDNINEFNALISDFSNEINNLIGAPQDLADSIVNIGAGFNGIQATTESQIEAWKGLFGFGDDDEEIEDTTAGLKQRRENNYVITNAVKVQGIGYSLLAGADSDPQTTEELDDLVETLNAQYNDVIAIETIDPDVRNSLVDLMNNVNDHLNEKRESVSDTIVISTPKMPARVISFQYYNDSSKGEVISQLNEDANVSFLEDDIKVVTL